VRALGGNGFKRGVGGEREGKNDKHQQSGLATRKVMQESEEQDAKQTKKKTD